MGLPERKRARRFAKKFHLDHFARQLWMADWFVYQKLSTRVDDWALTLANVYSSARIGEYIESLSVANSQVAWQVDLILLDYGQASKTCS